MARWRDIKHNKGTATEQKAEQAGQTVCAPVLARIKAFIVDMFMIMMPIMYLTTYVFMGGKDDFQASESARWITALIFGAIIIAFWVIKGQTPGLKAYSIKLIDSATKNNLSIGKALLRYILFLTSAVTIILAFLPFFREDRKTLQDLLTNSCVTVE
jgi:uncharacterized RDD family membrane protein YckC